MTTTTVKVNIGAISRQMFHPCDPDFIRDVCHAKCCRSTTDPTGIAVVVTRKEALNLMRLGATVDPTSGRVEPVNRRCPFQHPDTHLCTIHGPDEPAGCVISPFTINPTGTLIVRNRYRLLPCFKAEGSVPVAHAHRRSLEAIFGPEGAAAIITLVDAGNDTTIALEVPTSIVDMLHHKNEASKA